jgi:hypothetical protein
MGVVKEARLRATPREVLSAIDQSLGRSDDVFRDLREIGGRTYGVAIYEQYFMRAGNRAAITVVADDFAADGTTLVRVVVTGSSRGLIINFDWGVAGDYAAEAIRIVSDLAHERGGLMEP